MKTRIAIVVIGRYVVLLRYGQRAGVQSDAAGRLADPEVRRPAAGGRGYFGCERNIGTFPEHATPTYNIHIMEFQAQILPSTGVPRCPIHRIPAGHPGIPANTASWVWGYLTDADVASTTCSPPELPRPGRRGEERAPRVPHILYINCRIGGQCAGAPARRHDAGLGEPLGHRLYPDADGVLPATCTSLPYLGPWPSAVHIHGGEVAPAFDGGPDAWRSPIGSGGHRAWPIR